MSSFHMSEELGEGSESQVTGCPPHGAPCPHFWGLTVDFGLLPEPNSRQHLRKWNTTLTPEKWLPDGHFRRDPTLQNQTRARVMFSEPAGHFKRLFSSPL